jgi:hypothetical protein
MSWTLGQYLIKLDVVHHGRPAYLFFLSSQLGRFAGEFLVLLTVQTAGETPPYSAVQKGGDLLPPHTREDTRIHPAGNTDHKTDIQG